MEQVAPRSSFLRRAWPLVVAPLVLSCFGDSTAPRLVSGHLALAPSFTSSAAGVVDFDRVRIRLVHVEGGTAVDTIIAVPPTADTIDLTVTVPLTAASEEFFFYMQLLNAAGDTVFRNSPYPQRVTITAGGSGTARPVETPIVYVGVGFDAVAVTIATADTFVPFGQTLSLGAVALGPPPESQPIPGTPIAWRSLDTTRVRVPNRAVGQVVGGSQRGPARIVAELLTGPADTVLVTAQPLPGGIAIVSGNGQSGAPGAALPLPLRVRVTGTDGLGIRVPVTFQAVSAGASVAPTQVTSDSTGYAEALGTLGPASGPQSFTATISGFPGVSFSATALSTGIASVTLDRVVDTIARGASLQYTATARDASGNPVPATIGWTSTVPTVATVDTAGLAQGVGGDSTKIIAGAAGHADTARLYVRALRSVVVAPADTVITAIGDSFDLRATAYDNFGAVITSGFTRTFVSASPTVVTVNATTGRAASVGPGNGVVVVRDSVDPTLKVQGTATVRVNQVTFSIRNTPAPPDTLQVGVNGRRAIIAEARDRNGHPIPNKTFGFRSVTPSIATVDAAGIVTGVALGETFVVDSVDGFKDSVHVAVVSAPPALIRWAFDSVAVGNGSNLSVPITLSRTDAAPVTVLLASSDTMIARPATGCPGGALRKVQIPAGASATSVVLCGLSAGRVTLVAQDSASVFLPDTLVVTVVSTIEFREIGQFSRQQNFYVNKNETHQAQVFLSDPAPAGGLGVTFVYGRAGTSAVLPSPAIIPAGQLSANVTIQGLAVGTDSVVPTSGGFVGKFSRVIVASNNLALQRPYPYTGTLGVGQTFQPYVGITYAMDHHLVISATLGSAIGTVQSPDTIRAGSSIQYFTVTATAPGRTALTVTASGWVSAADTFTFTTPHLRAFGPSSIVAGDPSRAYWSAYAGDSIGYDHLVKDTLVVTAVSRNPAAVVVDSATLRIPAGSSGATRSNAVRALATAGGDSAWVVVTASGYTADSFLVRVTKPTLTTQLSYPYTGRIGLGTLFQNAGYVDLPYARPDTFTVTFGHSAAARVRGPATVRIPPSQTRAYFTLVGDALGVDTMFVDTVATPGYVVAGSPLVYQVDSLHVGLYTYPSGTNYTIAAPSPVTVYAYDPVDGQARPLIAPLRVNLASSDTATFTLDSAAVTIDSGQFHSVNHPDTLRFRGVDTVGARILTSAPGSTPDSSGLIRVFPTPLGIQLGYPYTVGRGLRLKSNYVYVTGGSVPDTVKVALRRFDPTLDTLTADTVRILKGQSVSQPFEIWALDSLRTDSIVATAVGYVPAKVSITPEAVSLVQAGLPATRATTDPPYRASVYTATRSRNVLNPFVPVNVAVVSTDPNVMQIDSAGVLNARGDTAVAVVDSNRAFGQVRVRFVGNGTARLRYSAPGFLGDSTVLVTVTGPALNLTTGSQTLGVGQLLPSQYVYVNNPVTDSALVVHLLRSDSTQPPANQVFRLSTDSVIIPVGQTISTLFDIEGNFTNSAVLTARANGYIQAVGTVSVGAPQLVAPPNLTLYVGQAPVPAYVYTADQGGVQRSVAAALVVQVTSSDTTIAKSDSATVTVPARDLDVLVPLRGRAKGVTTAIFTATGYKADTTAVSVDTAQLSFGSVPASLGPGQTAQVYVALPFTNDSAITVSLVSSDPAVLSVPASVVIPARGASASFTVTGVAAGSATITGSAPGKAKPGTSAAIPVGTPKLQLFFQANTNVGQKYILTVYAEDSLGTARPVATPLTVTLTSSVPTATTFDSSSITIPAGSFSVSTGVTFTQAGSYTLTGTAPGYASANINSNATGALVSMSGTAFGPNSVAIQAGQVVTWRNEDSFNHTTTSDAALWTATLAPAQTHVRTFSTPGTFTYHCNIHPAMTGTVVVNP